MSFSVKILGTGSAIPTYTRNLSGQIVTFNDRYFLVDCGEATQMHMLRNKIKLSRLDGVFISHLHGDHVFGLFGLLTSMSIYGRTSPLPLYAPAGAKVMLDTVFAQTKSYLTYELDFHPLEDYKPGSIIFTNKSELLQVRCLPLKHRIFVRGFRFEEVNKRPHFDFFRAKALDVPNPYFKLLKQGNTITLKDGRVITPEQVLKAADEPLSYAYCSDTCFHPPLVEHIKETSLLYHEATFLHELKERAIATAHSTALEAATIAKEAVVGHLLLGHFSARYHDTTPLLEEAQTVFPATTLANEGMDVEVKK